ncbi:hypothetical protein TeGR_g14162 [Tetraparma gracilis]|uniref:BEACH domain-containing protein n=1 Tax=Tetraparma gracilis TaxID=2962635 RepID=A0ABQ6MSJ2_9STRA|nr:hypothetical protein TeGR_g14162 [Tetraparma gracilis]
MRKAVLSPFPGSPPRRGYTLVLSFSPSPGAYLLYSLYGTVAHLSISPPSPGGIATFLFTVTTAPPGPGGLLHETFSLECALPAPGEPPLTLVVKHTHGLLLSGSKWCCYVDCLLACAAPPVPAASAASFRQLYSSHEAQNLLLLSLTAADATLSHATVYAVPLPTPLFPLLSHLPPPPTDLLRPSILSVGNKNAAGVLSFPYMKSAAIRAYNGGGYDDIDVDIQSPVHPVCNFDLTWPLAPPQNRPHDDVVILDSNSVTATLFTSPSPPPPFGIDPAVLLASDAVPRLLAPLWIATRCDAKKMEELRKSLKHILPHADLIFEVTTRICTLSPALYDRCVQMSYGHLLSTLLEKRPPPPLTVSSLLTVGPPTPQNLLLRYSDISVQILHGCFPDPALWGDSLISTIASTFTTPETPKKFSLANLSLQMILDNISLAGEQAKAGAFTASSLPHLVALASFLLKLRLSDAINIKGGEAETLVCIRTLVQRDLKDLAATVVLETFVGLLESEDQLVCVRFGQALQGANFMKYATVMLSNTVDSRHNQTAEWRENWRMCLQTTLWLASATGSSGARHCETLGKLMYKSASGGLLPLVISDDLTNYLFLGGPASNINRLKVVLPILPALVAALIHDANASSDYSSLTKFLATAGVALKSDFLAVSALADSVVGYLDYLIIVVREIEKVILSAPSASAAPLDANLLLDLSFDDSSASPPPAPASSDSTVQQLVACQDLTLDACSSLLVDAMRMGGVSSTRAWCSIVSSLRAETPALLSKLACMAIQRSVRSEEQPWSPDLCDGISRLCLLVEEKRLLNLSQGAKLEEGGGGVQLLLAILELMRVGRESMGWHQVVVGASASAAPELLERSQTTLFLLKVLQPSLRIALTSLPNLSSASVVGQVVTELEMTVHAASSGLAFAGARDVGLLVLAGLRKAIMVREAASDMEVAGEFRSLTTIVISELAQRHAIEKLQKETEQGEGGDSGTMVVEALIFGELTDGSIPDALSPNQILPSSPTTLGWANYAGLGDTLKIANRDTDSVASLSKLSAYLDAWDECSMRESQDELLALFDVVEGQQFGRKLPKYMLTNSQVVDQDEAEDLMSFDDDEAGGAGAGGGVGEGLGMDASVEKLARDLIRKTSLTVKDITLEQVVSTAEDEADDAASMEPPRESLAVTPPLASNSSVEEAENTNAKVSLGDITGEYSEGSAVYEQMCPPDGSLLSGGAGRPEAKFLSCLHVRACGSRECTVYVTPHHLVLNYVSNLYDGEAMALEEIKMRMSENTGGVSEEDEDRFEMYRDVEYRTKSLRFEIGEIAQIYLRRYRLRDSAIEIFFNGAAGGNVEGMTASSLFIDCGGGREGGGRRDGLGIMLMKKCPRSAYKQWPGTSNKRMLLEHSNIPKLWADGKVSNFDYIMYINTLAGRSMNDITQYPVFPWVLNDYTSETLDLRDEANYRDLSKPVGALNADRLVEFRERYDSFVDPTIPSFMYGSHYSTAAGVVLHYNVRLHPFAGLHRQLQGGHFDVADRLFSSVARTWEMCTSALSEVKELTPEWFSSPGFLRNQNDFNFGKMQDGERVDDVLLPPWCGGSPEKFVEMNRAALESDIVTKMLPDWIDLIFGHKQRGQAAVDAHNVFFYLTYYGSVDVAAIEDESLRRATELQIAHFGQCPMQLFTSPHVRAATPETNLKTSMALYAVDDAQSTSDLPFTGAPLAHWHHLPPPSVMAQPAAITTIRLVSKTKIFTIDAAGNFSFYSWVWKPDLAAINREKEAVRLKRQAALNGARASMALAQGQALSQSRSGSFSVEPGEFSPAPSFEGGVKAAGAGESAIAAEPPLPLGTIDEDVGTFHVSHDVGGFKEILPRLFRATSTVAISQRAFAGGTKCLVISDGDGRGAVGFQSVEIDTGTVINQVMLPRVFSKRASVISTDVCPSSGVEIVCVGSEDGAMCCWRFKTADQLPTRPMLAFSGHNGCAITCASANVHLRCIVSTSTGGKVCVHSLVSGALVRSWQVPGKITNILVVKRGFLVVACDMGETTVLLLYTVEGVELSSKLVTGRVTKLREIADGCAVAVCMQGAVKLLRISACMPFATMDTWGIDTHGFDMGGAGTVDVSDFDCGPDRRLSSYPAVAAAGMADGSIRIHALPGVTAWSRTVGGSVASSVVGLVAKPVNLVGGLGKGLIGGLGAVGKGLVSLTKEVGQELNSEGGNVVADIKKEGLGGWFGKLRQGRKTMRLILLTALLLPQASPFAPVPLAFKPAPSSALSAQDSGYYCLTSSPPTESLDAVHNMLVERADARRERDFDTADSIREDLFREFQVSVYDADMSFEFVAPGSRPPSRSRPPQQRGGQRGPAQDFGAKGHDYQRSGGDKAELTDEQLLDVDDMLRERLECKLRRDFRDADDLQERLREDYGVNVNDGRKEWRADGQDFSMYERDGPAGDDETEGFVGEVSALLKDRFAARRDRDYDAADTIKDELRERLGVFVDDRARTWSVGRPANQGAARDERQWRRGDMGSEDEAFIAGVEALVAERAECKMDRNYDRADAIVAQLSEEFGVSLNDRMRTWAVGSNPLVYGRTGGAEPGEHDSFVDEVTALVLERSTAKAARDYDTADGIRDQLRGMGVSVNDKTLMWTTQPEPERRPQRGGGGRFGGGGGGRGGGYGGGGGGRGGGGRDRY